MQCYSDQWECFHVHLRAEEQGTDFSEVLIYTLRMWESPSEDKLSYIFNNYYYCILRFALHEF